MASAPAGAAAHPKVLVLHQSHRGFPVTDSISDGVIHAARQRGSGASDVYVEYLDLVRYNSPEDQRKTAELLLWKMKKIPLKAIVAGGGETMDFLAGEARDLAPGVPVLMATTAGRTVVLPGRQVTNVPLRVDFQSVLRTVSDALPQCTRVLVVTGGNFSDRSARLEFKDAATAWQGRFSFEYTDEMSHAAMLDRVAHLEPHSAIVFVSYFGDATGKPLVSAEVVNSVAKLANAPVFVTLEGHFRPGVLGGPLLPFNAFGQEIGRLALDLASGRPVVPQSMEASRALLVPTFNWAQVQRWRIDPDALPKGSVFPGRPQSLWQEYREEMSITAIAFAMLCAVTIALSLQSRRLQRAEQAAVASEERVRVLIEAAPEAILSFDADTGLILDANPRSAVLLGAAKETLILRRLDDFFVAGEINGVHVAPSIAEQANQVLEGAEPQFERLVLRANDQSIVPCEVRLARLPDPHRRLVRATLTDIAERKAIDSALYLLAGRSGSDEKRRDFIVDTLRELCAVIEVDVALIASLDKGDSAQTWVRWAGGGGSFGGGFGIRGTLCERVASERTIQLVTSDASAQMPAGVMPAGVLAQCAGAAALWNSQNQCIGFLLVAGARPMRHPERARAVLQIVAGRAAQELEGMHRDRELTVHQASLEAQVAMRTADLAQANDKLQGLSEVGRQVAASLDPQVIDGALRAGLSRLMPLDGLQILIIEASGRLHPLGTPLKPSADDPDTAETFERELRRCADQPGVTVISRAAEAPAWPGAPEGARSALVAPLVSQQGPIGLLVVYTRAHADQSVMHLAMLETLALHVASAISNSRAFTQLRFAQDQLVEREKMAALGSLVAGVAHELNTPLGNALLLTSTLNDRVAELTGSSAQPDHPDESMQEFHRVVRQAGGLIERSLRSAAALVSSFKQVAVDQTMDRRRAFDLAEVVGELVATVHNQLKTQRHELVLQIPNGIVMDSHPGALIQVLGNLIANALQHGLDGRVNGRISIAATLLRDEVLIEFADNGCGISEAHLRRVFEPFFTTRLGKGGSGLGLSISYSLVTSVLGGSISVSSPAGSGALFRLVIPTRAPVQAQASSTANELPTA